MARLFVFGIGGTGSRVIKSLIMLLASGLKPGKFDEVIPIIIDPHKDLKELNECKKMVRLYSKINERMYQNVNHIDDGFFITKMTTLKSVSTDTSLSDDIEFDEKHTESFGDFIKKGSIRRISPTTLNLLSLLYSDKNFAQPLSVGFKGSPHMGSMVLNSIIGGPAYNAFISTFGKNDRIFIISSMFGGTGAAGFPLLLQNFRKSINTEMQSCQIGALSIMPYFKLDDPGQTSDIDSNDFITKTKSALTYYTRPDFTTQYNAMYYLADPYQQTEPYKNDEQRQENKAHIIELLGALSLFHFASNTFAQGEVYEYCLNEDKDKIHFNNLGNSAREIISKNLTALHLLSKLHSKIKAKQKSLSFCKINEFNSSFFNNPFFVDNEEGLEKFFENYYNQWISELDINQRSFSPFNLKVNESFNSLVKCYESEKNFWDGIFTRPTDMSDLLTRVSSFSVNSDIKKLNDKSKFCQYLAMCFKASNDFIISKINSKVNS